MKPNGNSAFLGPKFDGSCTNNGTKTKIGQVFFLLVFFAQKPQRPQWTTYWLRPLPQEVKSYHGTKALFETAYFYKLEIFNDKVASVPNCNLKIKPFYKILLGIVMSLQYCSFTMTKS